MHFCEYAQLTLHRSVLPTLGDHIEEACSYFAHSGGLAPLSIERDPFRAQAFLPFGTNGDYGTALKERPVGQRAAPVTCFNLACGFYGLPRPIMKLTSNQRHAERDVVYRINRCSLLICRNSHWAFTMKLG